MSWSMVPSSTFAAQLCCGALPKACRAPPPSNTWKHCGRKSMQPARSVPWASTRWPSPPCIARTRRTRSNPGSTSSVATCTATTTGATTARRGRAGRAGIGSVPCVELKGRTCRCGWAVRRGSTSTPPHPPTPLTPVATFVQRRQRPSGVRSRCRTARTPSMLPAPSVPSS